MDTRENVKPFKATGFHELQDHFQGGRTMKHTGKTLAAFLLSLALMLGLAPGMSLTAYVDDDWRFSPIVYCLRKQPQ
jgi:hypothetical protein